MCRRRIACWCDDPSSLWRAGSRSCQRVCKPGSVHPVTGDGRPFLSDDAYAPPLATNPSDAPERGAYAAPIRSCSRWGLPCRSCRQDRGALLPHPFTVAGPKPSPSALCGTFPRVTPAGRYPAPSFRGARTFLDALAHDAAARPSGDTRSTRPLRAWEGAARAGSSGTRPRLHRRSTPADSAAETP